MIRKIINAINAIIPKRKLVIFNSFPDISGNPLSLFRFIISERPDIVSSYEMIWTANNDIAIAQKLVEHFLPGKDIKVIKKKSVAGLIKYLQAQYIVTSHNYLTGVFTKRNQKHVNLWHGMPFKTIGRLIQNEGSEDNIQADITIATSPVFQKIMSDSIGLDVRDVLVTGQPCVDELFSESDALSKLGIKKQYSRILMWMPTYRKSAIGSIHEDGILDSLGPVDVLENHFDELETVLKHERMLLIIKPHPMDSINSIKFQSTENIKMLKNEDLDYANVELYSLLGQCDGLLTDYSSVFIDYLNLQRPIAFICSDIAEYSRSRGFCFSPPRDYLPGEFISDFEGLVHYIYNFDEINQLWANKRFELNRLLNTYSDAQSSARVCNSIFGIQNKS